MKNTIPLNSHKAGFLVLVLAFIINLPRRCQGKAVGMCGRQKRILVIQRAEFL